MSTLEQLRKLLEQAELGRELPFPFEVYVARWMLKDAAVNALPKLIACAEALKQWEHWYSVDSEEYNRDNAREAGRAALAALEGEGRG